MQSKAVGDEGRDGVRDAGMIDHGTQGIQTHAERFQFTVTDCETIA